jgi:RNA polymerase sigma-70 factor (ECF subfamily)
VTSIPSVVGVMGVAGLSPEVLAARTALTRGLNTLRSNMREAMSDARTGLENAGLMMSTGIQRGNGVPRTRNRPGVGDQAQPYTPGGNSKAAEARLGGKPSPVPHPQRPGDERERLDPLGQRGPTDLEPGRGNAPGGPQVPTQHEPPEPEPAPVKTRPDPTDAAAGVWVLVERAQAGDAEAFGQIYDRYLDTVFRFIYFRVGNRQLAEDLTSDTFLRALKRIGSFTWQGRDPGAWLVTIARNLVADHFKSGRYRLEVTTGDVLDADREDRGPEGSPEAAVVDHITNVALLTAVKQLNPEQQECIVLRFLHGFSVAETAQAMGKNEGAIKALQYRAVRALARLLPEGFKS